MLRAVDDLLVDVGYSAMTMKGIAERAGVGRQTVYRWWSTKAEILYEASVLDAEEELAVAATGRPTRDLTAYVRALITFLARSHAGAAYRALLGEAQHDPAVAAMIRSNDVVGDSARAVLQRTILPPGARVGQVEQAVAALAGPPFFWVLSGHDPARFDVRGLVDSLTRSARQ